MNGSAVARRALLLWASLPLLAADPASYRGFQLRADLGVTAQVAGVPYAEAKLVHQRPERIEELRWRPQLDNPKDPLKEVILEFYNGRLFRIAATYDRYRMEGLTEADVVEGISAVYGLAARPRAEIAYRSIYGVTAAVTARWEDNLSSADLIRVSEQSDYVLVLYDKDLDRQAQVAKIEAVRLDALDAPQREAARKQLREEEERLRLEKARSINKPSFRP